MKDEPHVFAGRGSGPGGTKNRGDFVYRLMRDLEGGREGINGAGKKSSVLLGDKVKLGLTAVAVAKRDKDLRTAVVRTAERGEQLLTLMPET